MLTNARPLATLLALVLLLTASAAQATSSPVTSNAAAPAALGEPLDLATGLACIAQRKGHALATDGPAIPVDVTGLAVETRYARTACGAVMGSEWVRVER